MFHTIFGIYLWKNAFVVYLTFEFKWISWGPSPSPATLKTRGSSVTTLITFNAYDKWLFILTEHPLCEVLISLPVLDTAPGHSELSTNTETQATSVRIHSKYRQNSWKTKYFQQGALQSLTPTLRWVSLQFTSSIINNIVDPQDRLQNAPPQCFTCKKDFQVFTFILLDPRGK